MYLPGSSQPVANRGHVLISSNYYITGKTAPRLVQDVQDYDPAHPPGTGRNLLSDVPPVYPEHYNGPQDFISSLACRHQYARKEMQTFLSQPDQRRNTGTPSRVSAMCTKCRTHLQVVVNYAGAIGQSGQNLSGHIHHFVYKSGRQRGGASPVEVTPKGQVAESFHYECSYLSCSAAASIRVLSPVLADDRVRLLTDVDLLAERTDAAIAAYPERMEGIARPPPINVLANLRIYITNAIRDVQHSKSISAVNKRFMACFGVEGRPCGELLEFLGFTFKVGTYFGNLLETELVLMQTRRLKASGTLPDQTHGQNTRTRISKRFSLTILRMSWQRLWSSVHHWKEEATK